MSTDIPEYYRHLAENRPERQAPGGRRAAGGPEIDAPEVPFRADAFSIDLYEGWTDKSVYILAGPVDDGIQHNITITLDPDVPIDSLSQYADVQINSIEQELKGCRLLLQDEVELDDGSPAARAIFSWYPSDDVRVYQEQLYVLNDGMGYKLTATFTKKTRKTLGPFVERMMRSFTPADHK